MFTLPKDILSSVETKINFRQKADNHQKYGPKPHQYLIKPSSKRAKGLIYDPIVFSARARTESSSRVLPSSPQL